MYSQSCEKMTGHHSLRWTSGHFEKLLSTTTAKLGSTLVSLTNEREAAFRCSDVRRKTATVNKTATEKRMGETTASAEVALVELLSAALMEDDVDEFLRVYDSAIEDKLINIKRLEEIKDSVREMIFVRMIANENSSHHETTTIAETRRMLRRHVNEGNPPKDPSPIVVPKQPVALEPHSDDIESIIVDSNDSASVKHGLVKTPPFSSGSSATPESLSDGATPESCSSRRPREALGNVSNVPTSLNVAEFLGGCEKVKRVEKGSTSYSTSSSSSSSSSPASHSRSGVGSSGWSDGGGSTVGDRVVPCSTANYNSGGGGGDQSARSQQERQGEAVKEVEVENIVNEGEEEEEEEVMVAKRSKRRADRKKKRARANMKRKQQKAAVEQLDVEVDVGLDVDVGVGGSRGCPVDDSSDAGTTTTAAAAGVADADLAALPITDTTTAITTTAATSTTTASTATASTALSVADTEVVMNRVREESHSPLQQQQQQRKHDPCLDALTLSDPAISCFSLVSESSSSPPPQPHHAPPSTTTTTATASSSPPPSPPPSSSSPGFDREAAITFLRQRWEMSRSDWISV